MLNCADSVNTVAFKVEKALSKWAPYRWHEASTGSIYIKFPHWGLGSIRIGDHPGRQRYSYTWEIRKNNAKTAWKIWVDQQCTDLNFDQFIKQFEERAATRHIEPGFRQTWEEYKGVATPDWKKKKYSKGGQ